MVRDSGTWRREWSRMFGSTPAPSVDFAKEQVLLLYDVGTSYAFFEVWGDSTGLTVKYRPISNFGPRRCLYRAVAVPRTTGGVTFQQN